MFLNIEPKLLETASTLPNWMQFIIILLFAIAGIVIMLLKYNQEKDITDKLIKNEDKLSTLLDLLFEKFANNVTIDVAKGIIQLVYIRTKYSTKDKVIDLFRNTTDIERVHPQLEEFINNKYFEDSMFLTRITYKGINLSNFHQDTYRPSIITKQIIEYIISNPIEGKCSNINYICNDLDSFLTNIFTTITNKTLVKLDERSVKSNQYN